MIVADSNNTLTAKGKIMISLPMKLKLVVASLLILNLGACQEKQEEIDARQTQRINGLIYKLYAQEPFTGKVLHSTDFTGYLNTHIYLSEGILKIHNNIYVLKDHYCDMEVKQGLLDGSMVCYYNHGKFFEVQNVRGFKNGDSKFWDEQTGSLLIETQWENDAKHGEEIIYDKSGQINMQTQWRRGQKNGIERIYNLDNRQLVADITWNNGEEEKVKRWDLSGQRLLQDYVVSQGKKTGFIIHEEYRKRSERFFQEGKLHGVQNDYEQNAQNEYQLTRIEPYDMGLKNGTHMRFDIQGHLLEEIEYKNGVALSVLRQEWEDGNLRAQPLSVGASCCEQRPTGQG